MKIKCPQCGEPVVYSDINQWRPFCSERCKLIDFGDWIDGKKYIPDESPSVEMRVDNAGNIKH